MMSFGKLTLQLISRPDYGGLPHVQADLLPEVPEPIPPGTMCSWQVRNLHITPMLVFMLCVWEKTSVAQEPELMLLAESPQILPENLASPWDYHLKKCWQGTTIQWDWAQINPYSSFFWRQPLWYCLMKLNGMNIVVINLIRFDSRWALSSLSNEFFPTTNHQVCCVSNRGASEGGAKEEGGEDWKVIALLQR